MKFCEIEKLTHERRKEHDDILGMGESESDTEDELANEPPITSDEDEKLVLEGGECEIDLEAAGIEDILADEEREKGKRASSSEQMPVEDAVGGDRDEGSYEIESWV